jgi:hypothetical protein
MGGADDKDSHADTAGCLGMWRLTEAVLDPEEGSVTVYVCDLCGAVLPVTTGGVHPGTA